MDDANPGRSAADELLALQVAAGKTLAEAAQTAGVSESTVDRRQRDPEFRKRVAELRAEVVASATARLSSGLTKAADVLTALLESENAGIRLRAAKSVYELVMRGREHAELAEQVAELQRIVATLTKGKPCRPESTGPGSAGPATP